MRCLPLLGVLYHNHGNFGQRCIVFDESNRICGQLYVRFHTWFSSQTECHHRQCHWYRNEWLPFQHEPPLVLTHVSTSPQQQIVRLFQRICSSWSSCVGGEKYLVLFLAWWHPFGLSYFFVWRQLFSAVCSKGLLASASKVFCNWFSAKGRVDLRSFRAPWSGMWDCATDEAVCCFHSLVNFVTVEVEGYDHWYH